MSKPLGKGRVFRLPAPLKNVHEQTAKQLFGVSSVGHLNTSDVLPVTPAVVITKGQAYSIAIHRNSINLQPFVQPDNPDIELPGLLRAFSYLTDVTFLIRALQTNYDAFQKHLINLKDQVNPEYQAFLDNVSVWGNPGSRKMGAIARDLWIWGPTSAMIPKIKGGGSAGLGGNFVSYEEYGPALRSILFGLPSGNLRSLKSNPDGGSINHLSWASPRNLIKRPTYLIIDNEATAYWIGELNAENVETILHEDFDILTRMRTVGRFMYQTTILRSRAPIDDIKRFDQKTDSLQTLGKWERITGSDLMVAFQKFVPGSTPLPNNWDYYSLPSYIPVFKKLVQSLRPASDPNGTSFLGKINGGYSLLVNPKSEPGWVYTGPSKKSGKTTKANADALSYIPPFYLPLTAENFSSHLYWAEKFWKTKQIFWGSKVSETPIPDQRIINLNLPDALQTVEEESKSNGLTRRIDPGTVLATQEKLHEKDRIFAGKIVDFIYETWKNYGTSVGLPISFRVQSGYSVRLMNFYDSFLSALRDIHRKWYGETGDMNLIVIDNFSTLVEMINRGDDPYIKDLGVQVAKNLASIIGWFVSNGANIGVFTRVITHDPSDFDIISGGYYHHFGLHQEFGKDEHITARVINPSNSEVIEQRLQIELPWDVLQPVQRQEPNSSTSTEVTIEKNAG